MLNRFGCEKCMFIEDPTLVKPMERLLRNTAEPHNRPFHGSPSKCIPMSRAKVCRAQRVVSPQLWHQYTRWKNSLLCCEEVKKTEEMRHLERIAFRLDTPYLGATYWIQLDQKKNEILLFHGTSASCAESIAKNGFDESRARRGKFGQGFYFACEACKSFQYSKTLSESQNCIVVARVILGQPKYVSSSWSGGKLEIVSERKDSIVALPHL